MQRTCFLLIVFFKKKKIKLDLEVCFIAPGAHVSRMPLIEEYFFGRRMPFSGIQIQALGSMGPRKIIISSPFKNFPPGLIQMLLLLELLLQQQHLDKTRGEIFKRRGNFYFPRAH